MNKRGKSKRKRKGINKKNSEKKNIILLGLTSLFNDMSTEMLTPILPLFLANVLGASGAVIGLIEGFAKAGENILSIFFGWLSDKLRKRKGLVVVGYGLSAIMKGFYALTIAWPQFAIARFTERTGKAIREPPRDALIAESVPKTERERRTGYVIHRILDTTGAVIGPLIAVFLLSFIIGNFESIARTIFLVSLAPAAVALIILAFVKEKKRVKLKERDKELKLSDMFNLAKYGKMYKHFLFSFALLFIAWPTGAFFFLKASEVGFALGYLLLLGALFSITYIFGATFIEILSKFCKIKGKGILFGMFSFAVLFLIFAFITRQIEFIIGFGVYGFVSGIIEVERRTYLSMVVPKRFIAGAFGTFKTTIGIASIISGLFIGLLWDVSHPIAFGFAALLAGIAFLVFLAKPGKS